MSSSLHFVDHDIKNILNDTSKLILFNENSNRYKTGQSGIINLEKTFKRSKTLMVKENKEVS